MLPSALFSRGFRGMMAAVGSNSGGGGGGGCGGVRPQLVSRPLQTTLSDAEEGGDRQEAEGKSKKTRLKLRSSGKRTPYPRVYTRKGDGGNSSLFTGERRPKDDPFFHALGITDELSSHIGLAMEFARANNHPYVDQLERVQCLLQDIGSALATPYSSAREVHVEKTVFNPRHTKELEEWIDVFADKLPPLENFILPGGGLASASLHVSRSVCRRAERAIAPLVAADEVDPEILRYVNRLSDLLFTVARVAARADDKQETVYMRPDSSRKDPPYRPGPNGMWKKEKEKE